MMCQLHLGTLEPLSLREPETGLLSNSLRFSTMMQKQALPGFKPDSLDLGWHLVPHMFQT